MCFLPAVAATASLVPAAPLAAAAAAPFLPPLWWPLCFLPVVVVVELPVDAAAVDAAAVLSVAAAAELAATGAAATLEEAAVELEAAEAPAAEPPVAAALFVWDTTMQLPKLPAVLKETRQRLPAVPPVHFVPEGRETESSAEPAAGGASWPFWVTVALVKLLPVPVGSTWAVTWVEPSCAPLKLTIEVENELVESRATAVELLMFDAMSVLPHGELVDGCWTSLRVEFPKIPS